MCYEYLRRKLLLESKGFQLFFLSWPPRKPPPEGICLWVDFRAVSYLGTELVWQLATYPKRHSVGVGMRIVMKSLETILKTNLGVWMTQPLFYLTFLSELFFLFRSPEKTRNYTERSTRSFKRTARNQTVSGVTYMCLGALEGAVPSRRALGGESGNLGPFPVTTWKHDWSRYLPSLSLRLPLPKVSVSLAQLFWHGPHVRVNLGAFLNIQHSGPTPSDSDSLGAGMGARQVSSSSDSDTARSAVTLGLFNILLVSCPL